MATRQTLGRPIAHGFVWTSRRAPASLRQSSSLVETSGTGLTGRLINVVSTTSPVAWARAAEACSAMAPATDQPTCPRLDGDQEGGRDRECEGDLDERSD